MSSWSDDDLNHQHVEAIRRAIAEGGRLLVFLGAGLSFGAARIGGRTTFDREVWGRDYPPGRWRRGYPPADYGEPPFAPSPELALDDDGLPLPSWPWLVSRMRGRLAPMLPPDDQLGLDKFFREQSPLDCAQLFRQVVGEANYREFLVEQFDARRYPFIEPTPAHAALVALSLPLIFTTNFDELIEDAHRDEQVEIRVSADENDFKARLAERPPHHLVKLHGSIDRPTTIVLTREDYAAARRGRQTMLGHLQHEMMGCSFLFVGFSLSDPNFNLIRDDIRESMGMLAPVCYTVQGERDVVKERYLTSLDVNMVWLDGWNSLPDFLRRIHPEYVTST